MSLEVERKYLDVDFEKLSLKLQQLDCLPESWHFESNIILDTQDASLYGQSKLLRLRKQEWADKSSYILTFKAPVSEKDARAEDIVDKIPVDPEKRDIKIREELEIKIPDLETMLKIFSGLGYEIWARYEKFRQTWRFPGKYVQSGRFPEPELVLDILPFANIVEIEGPELFINQMEMNLGLDKFKKSSTNYHKLHQQWRQENCLPPQRDFIFESDERENLRKKLNLPV